MKAAYIDRPGTPEAIRFGEMPTPPLGDRDVLVRVTAVAVNPIDTYIRSGAYPTELPAPFIIGRDMTGVVVQCGRAVRQFEEGARVWCNNQGYNGRQGTFAEQLSIDERLLYRLPPEADEIETVAVVHSGLTALIGLFGRARLESGETIFVNGGDGNVGTAVLQFAKIAGARVMVTAGSAEKADWCRELGADAVVDYKTEDVIAAVHDFAPAGVDVYWDASGTVQLDDALAVVARRGRLVIMSGISRRAAFDVSAFYTRDCSMFGFTVTGATIDELSTYAEQLNDAFRRRLLRPRVHSILPLERAADAHRMLERGGVFGKIVLVPDYRRATTMRPTEPVFKPSARPHR